MNKLAELRRQEASRLQEQKEKEDRNPLSKYSTSQLKSELRRRKRGQ